TVRSRAPPSRRPEPCADRAGNGSTPQAHRTRARTEKPMPDCYPQLTDTQRTVRDTIRRIVETELRPHVEAMEHGDVLPYPYIKKLAAGLGMAGTGDLPGAMAAAAPEDRLEFLVPAAVGIEIARVCGGVLVSCGGSYGQGASTAPGPARRASSSAPPRGPSCRPPLARWAPTPPPRAPSTSTTSASRAPTCSAGA